METHTRIRKESLHALYLASRGGDGITMDPPMKLALQASFGSVEGWRDEFVAMTEAQQDGAGWSLLSFWPQAGRLVNHWCAANADNLVEGLPILALDTAAHGRQLDPSAAAFVSQIDWGGAYARYQTAVHDTSESLAAQADDLAQALVLDVRRAGVYDAAATMLPDARWRDPATVAAWAPSLPPDREVIVYCVYGHEVGRATAMRLRATGLKARYLQGGIDAWAAAGRPVVPKPTTGKDGIP